MHEYYAKSAPELRQTMDKYMSNVKAELEEAGGKPYAEVLEDIWALYEREMLEYFPYIGGDKASGTSNLTDGFMLVACMKVLEGYGKSLDEAAYVATLSYQRYAAKMPGIVKKLGCRVIKSGLMNRFMHMKDKKNAANAEAYPGSFETETQEPTSEYSVIYHTKVCPLAAFAKEHGFERYQPYECNLDYAIFGELNVPLRRTHTCFQDGDYCDFCLARNGDPLPFWPPVFTQDNEFK